MMNIDNKYLLGIDIGTTNVKAILFSVNGVPVAMGEKEYPTYYPEHNAAEQSADDWWQSTVCVIQKIVNNPNVSKGKIAAICVSSQMPTLLPLDENGNPLRRGMIWMDRRAEKECLWLLEQFGKKKYKEIFGKSRPDPFHVMPKLLWLKNHEPEIYKKTKKIHLTNTYINYKLTGSSAVDDLQAESSRAYDVLKKDWSIDLENLTGIPLHDLMPEVHSIFDIIGYVNDEAAEQTGLEKGIPVLCGMADGHANIVEGGVTKIGYASESTGTTTLLFIAHSKPLSPQGRLSSMSQFFPIPDVPYTLIAPINSAGASLKWYLNTYKEYIELINAEIKESNLYNALNVLAQKSPAGSGGLFFFPYLSGERAPFWNSYVKGMFIGLTAASSHENIIRSLYEGTSFALRSVVEEAYREGAVINRIRSSGGGANSDIWLKIKASMLKMPLEVSLGMGGAPMGDAIVAGYGIGLYQDFVKAVETFQHVDKVVDPVDEWVKIYDDMYPVYISMINHLDNDLQMLEEVVCQQQLQS